MVPGLADRAEPRIGDRASTYFDSQLNNIPKSLLHRLLTIKRCHSVGNPVSNTNSLVIFTHNVFLLLHMVIVITIYRYKKIAGNGTPDQRSDISSLGLGYFLKFFVIGL